MANRDVMNDMLTKRWSDTDAPAPAAAVSVSSQIGDAPIGPQQRHNLETLIYSISNRTGAGNIPATVTVAVRHATLAGTVIASMDHIVAPSSTTNVAIARMGIQGKRGKAIRVTMDTVVASLTQKVSIAGWYEDD